MISSYYEDQCLDDKAIVILEDSGLMNKCILG